MKRIVRYLKNVTYAIGVLLKEYPMTMEEAYSLGIGNIYMKAMMDPVAPPWSSWANEFEQRPLPDKSRDVIDRICQRRKRAVDGLWTAIAAKKSPS